MFRENIFDHQPIFNRMDGRGPFSLVRNRTLFSRANSIPFSTGIAESQIRRKCS